MGLYHGPKSVVDNLILCIDAENLKSYGGFNYIANSSYSATDWTNNFPGNTTITTSIGAPDGTNTAIRVTCANTGSSLIRVSFPTFTPNGTDTYTSSFYARLITPTYGPQALVTDVNDGNPSINYGSQLVANTWVRVEASGIPTATGKSFVDLISDSTTNAIIDFWGVQLEPEVNATALTPTSGAAKTTRLKKIYDMGIANTAPIITFTGASRYTAYSKKFDTNSTTVTQQNYLTPSSTISFSDGSEYSMEFWVKLRSGAESTFHSLVGQLITTQWLSIYPNNTLGTNWYIRYRENSAVYRDSNTITDINIQNQWTHIAVTVDELRNVNFYVNGRFLNSVAATSTVFNIAAIMGGYASAGNYFSLQGSMAACRIYSKTLSDDEVRSNFFSLRARFGI